MAHKEARGPRAGGQALDRHQVQVWQEVLVRALVNCEEVGEGRREVEAGGAVRAAEEGVVADLRGKCCLGQGKGEGGMRVPG